MKLRLCLGTLMTTSAESDILQLDPEGDPALGDTRRDVVLPWNTDSKRTRFPL